MNSNILNIKGRTSILVEESYVIRFDRELYMRDLHFYEPNYYQLKLHVDLIRLVETLFTDNEYVNNIIIDGIVEGIMEKGLIEEGCTFDGLSRHIHDIFQGCMNRIAVVVGTLDFKLKRCSASTGGSFLITLERWT